MKPQRIVLSRKKGFNLQKFSKKLNGLPAVNCARPGKWGNPFRVCDDRTAAKAVMMFMCLAGDGTDIYKAAKRELSGKNLACWCKGSPCHCDYLLEIANH